MNDFDIPIFKKSYELYKLFHSFRNSVPKQDRFTTWQRCENIILDIVENILWASQAIKSEKLPILEKTSLKLNFLRIFLRLLKDTKTIDSKKYISLETLVDEIGRMLGGWIKSTKSY
ncbi:MAG: diversity-generating retroelement protein Avd [Candidatus Komeilibacteria bacterium]